MSAEGRLARFKEDMKPRMKDVRFTLRKIRNTPLSMVGIGLILFYVVLALAAPILAPPTDPNNPFLIPSAETVYTEPFPPSANHIFGTSYGQIDIYYGCIWGVRAAFRLGIIVIVGTLAIGLSLGLVAGYYGGLMDEIIMRFTDIILAFPGLILTMALIMALSRQGFNKLDAAIIGIVIVGWPGYTRLIRGEVLRVKTEDYVEAARASGASDLRIIGKHILPNGIYPVVIVASLDFGTIVLFAAALSFLGLGAEPRYADWGRLIESSRNAVTEGLRYWWTFIFPGLFITTFCLGWNLMGDAIRDILDPLYRRK
jgi:peptide/nickel transport system permease protein